MNYLKLVRYPNLIIIALSQISPFLSAFGKGEMSLNISQLVILIIFTLCMAAAGYVENDIFDLAIDRINKSEKVIVEEKISVKNAWVFVAILHLIAFLIAVLMFIFYKNYLYFVIFAITAALLFSYAKWLKKSFLIGNLIVSFLCALTPAMLLIFADLLLSNNLTAFPKNIDFYINFSFLITFFREIIKDMEDIEGDKSQGAKTLPIVAGIFVSRLIALLPLLFLLLQVFILSVGIRSSELEVKSALSSYFAFIFIEIPLLMLIIQTIRAKHTKQFHSISFFTKIVMLTGLVYLVL
jgi:4-hydroxybenzoate polyprenyltransferase